jgi:hypothetical protein
MVTTKTTARPKQRGLDKQYPREFAIWCAMQQRCGNKKCNGYKYYGARGIRVCARWAGPGGFRKFLADVGPQPFPRASVERRNNDGDYRPGNVCWADARAQARNTRRNRRLTYKARR